MSPNKSAYSCRSLSHTCTPVFFASMSHRLQSSAFLALLALMLDCICSHTARASFACRMCLYCLHNRNVSVTSLSPNILPTHPPLLCKPFLYVGQHSPCPIYSLTMPCSSVCTSFTSTRTVQVLPILPRLMPSGLFNFQKSLCVIICIPEVYTVTHSHFLISTNL